MSTHRALTRIQALLRRIAEGRGATLVKHRLMHVSTLSRGFRAAVYASYGLLAVVAVLTALHHKLENTNLVSVAGIAIPTGVVVAGAPIFAIALFLVLTGVILASARLRYSMVAVTALFLLPFGRMARKGVVCCDQMQVQNARPSILVLTLLFESMAVVLLTAALLARKLRTSYIAGLCLLAVLLPVATAWLVSARWHPGFGAAMMVLTFVVFMFVIIPALVLVGLDLMEWSMLLGGFTSDAMDPKIWPAGLVLACIALLANLVLGAYRVHWDHAGAIAIRAGLLAAAMGLLLLIAAFSADATHAHHLRHLKLFGIAALAVFCSFFVSSRETDAPPPVFNYHGERAFSIKYPQGWEPKLLQDGRQVVWFRAAGEHVILSVVGLPRTPTGAQYLNDIIYGGDQFPQTKLAYEASQEREWDKFETTLKNSKTAADIHFIVWHADAHSSEWFLDTDWYVIGACNVKYLDKVRPKFEAAWQSFTLTLRTVPAPNNRKIILGIWAAIAVLAAGWLGLRRSSAKPAMMLLLAVAGVTLALNAAGELAGEANLNLYGETFYCAQIVFALAGAMVLFWLFRKRTENRDNVIHTLLSLNLAFLLAYAFSAAYGFGSVAGERHNAMKGVVILLALSWEIATSGELTNYATRSFPRNSRVLLCLGYVLLVGFAVFSFFPTTYRITQRMAGFDSERWVVGGILMVGVPFLMATFSARMAHLLWHKQPEAISDSSLASEQGSPPAEPA